MKNPEGAGGSEKQGVKGGNVVGGTNVKIEGMQDPRDSELPSIAAAVEAVTPDRMMSSDNRAPPVDTGHNLAGLDRHVQARLGQRLKAMFDTVAKEPVPKRFLELLEALDRQDKRR